ncbi:L,D-transpeptidase [Bosea sp. CS1GBMeth4]|uniref:L,D-transpeptidase n=1 Tax=Bosea sp. CS1GBMeth4 TaxID=1892849 RepID=UPI0016476F62|nr:L,D-transpeptidase [Bosea sp. CS1GBMeth4]
MSTTVGHHSKKNTAPYWPYGSIKLSRRWVVSSLIYNSSPLALTGCGMTAQPQNIAQTRRFAGEPFEVRAVNRARFDPSLQPTRVPNTTGERPGTVVIDTAARQLFLVEDDGKAARYGVAVGAAGQAWKGRASVGRKTAWPAWYPTDEMKKVAPGIPARIPPGEDNPLGARALYLYRGGRDTLYRIHGTSEPWTIGTEASSGCIRMFNEDVIALYDRVRIGTSVLVK